jgi:predicted N-formylglutamate amidohydrolase
LSAAVAAPAVIAQFSRLLVDANRPLDSPTLFRDVADGQPVHLNQGTHRGRK